MSKWLPGPHEVVKEGLIVLGGVLIAAYLLSRMPQVRAFVQGNSLTVTDGNGNVLY